MAVAPETYRGHAGRRIALRDLDAKLVGIGGAIVGGNLVRVFERQAPPTGTFDLANADGIRFLCPKCFTFNGGPVGTHSVICWFVGRVPDNLSPQPGRWTPAGTGIDDLTFVPGTPPRQVSVQLEGGCGMHGVVIGGTIESDR
jgi:hypothetical protein